MLWFAVYTGKGTIPGLDCLNSMESIVLNFVNLYLNTNRILLVDNFYNTIKLNYILLNHKTGLVGTLKKNRTLSYKKIKMSKVKNTSNMFIYQEYKNICMILSKDRIHYYF